MNKLVVKKTQIELILDRGYQGLPNELILLNEDINTQSIKKYKKLDYNAVYKKSNHTLYVYYFNNVNPIKSLEEFVSNSLNYDKVMLIGFDSEKKNKGYTVILDKLGLIPLETFTFEDLMYNVTKHISVPKHTLIKNFNLASKDELPILLTSDPVARYYGWVNGDIIQITRNYDLNLLSNYEYGYRIVRNHL